MAGLVTFTSNTQLDARDAAEAERKAVMARQDTPVMLGLAAHLMKLWDAARMAKQPIETTMLRGLRQRNGTYEADKASEIAKTGGSSVYMMVTETKCRGAESWLRDILLDSGVVPFAIKPSPIPAMPKDFVDKVTNSVSQKVIAQIQESNIAPDSIEMAEMEADAAEEIRNDMLEAATVKASAMESRIRDQFAEGGMLMGFDEFISDLVTYKNAVLKGPTTKRVRGLEWVVGQDGKYAPQVTEQLKPTYSRVDPYRFYVEPGITRLEEGYTFEHHRLTRSDLSALLGVPGYDDGAIRAVLEEMPQGGMTSWMWSAEMQKSELEQKYNIWSRPTEMCDALEFWGKISGKLLREWGMSEEDVPDPAQDYDCNGWLINRWVIKATLNYDPLGCKPYKSTSFIKRPGSFWGSGIPEIIEDIQAMCNGAARALMNNMGLASGPQVEVNTDRLAPEEVITQIYPWKIWQVTNDPLGSGQPAIRFTQPDDRSQPLMTVYKEFLRMADDQSGIPAYIYGDGNVGGAGRTASGLSMLMGSAGKGIRQVIMHIDFEVLGPMVRDQYNWNMRYLDDESIKGDCEIVPQGAVTLANREQLNVRRVEFLQATANPIDSQIIGPKGRAAILREVAKGLSMPVNDIIPSETELDMQVVAAKKQQEAQLQQEQAAAQQAGTKNIAFQHDPSGKPVGATLTPGGAPAGGGDANQVTSRVSGKAA